MRYVHTVLQLAAMALVAWSIFRLTGQIGWSGLFLGFALLIWSALAELASARPIANSQADINLREVA